MASSTVMTPSLPTFCIAAAIILPMVASPFEEMVPTCATSDGRADLLGALLDVGDDGGDCEIDAALEIHRVHAGGNRLGAFLDDRGGEHGRRGGAVAGLVIGLRGDFAHHLRAHVLELVFELDLLGDGDAVLGDAGSAEALVDHDVAALGAERDFHGVGERLDAAQHAVAGVGRKILLLSQPLFCSLRVCRCRHPRSIFHQDDFAKGSVQAITPMMSDSFMMRRSSPSSLTSVPDHLPNSTRSPALRPMTIELAVLVAAARTDGDDFALLRLLLDGVGNDDAAFGFFLGFDALDDNTIVQGTEFELRHDHLIAAAMRPVRY